MSRAKPVVALDGPAGAGKSTVARAVADQLGFVLVDTGALYRGIALAARERDVSWDDPEALGELARGLELAFDGAGNLCIEGVDRAADIRTPEVSQGASKVSAHPPVRDALMGIQRALGAEGGVVLEGRDIGTVVFPDAEVKIFLTASVEKRAERRMGDLKNRGVEADMESLLESIRERDHRDSTRAVAPLKPAEDAELVDTTTLDFDEVVSRVVRLVRARL